MNRRRRLGFLIRLNPEEGVAAITVLLIIAVTATLGAMVLFAVNQDLGFVRVDSTSARSLALAEGGLDLAAEYLFVNQLSASAAVGTNVLTVTNTVADAAKGESGTIDFVIEKKEAEKADFRVISTAKITRAGGSPVVTILKQTMTVDIIDIPFGLFIDGDVQFGGNPKLFNESVLVNGNIERRDQVSFDVDSDGQLDEKDLGWIFHRNFVTATAVGGSPAIDFCGEFNYPHTGVTETVACSSAFAAGQILTTAQGTEIHARTSDPHAACDKDPPAGLQAGCAADRDTHQQNGSTKVVTVPGDVMTRHLPALRRVAQSQGLYVDLRNGSNDTVQYNEPDFGTGEGRGHKHFDQNLVLFFDAEAGDNVGLKLNLIPGDAQGGPAPNCSFFQEAASEGAEVCSVSGLVVVLGGSLTFASGSYWSGAVYVPSGELTLVGGVTFVGTMYVKGFATSGGNNTVKLESAWFGRIPTGFRQVVRSRWVECESFQECA